MLHSLIQPKRPSGPGWQKVHNPKTAQLDSLGYAHATWIHVENGIIAISAVEVAAPVSGEVAMGPEYHLSISAAGNRCSSADALWVLAQFDLIDATEDNHVPSGRVRNFWRPVADHLAGYECPCAKTEPTIREDKGDFVWRPAP